MTDRRHRGGGGNVAISGSWQHRALDWRSEETVLVLLVQERNVKVEIVTIVVVQTNQFSGSCETSHSILVERSGGEHRSGKEEVCT